MIKQIIKIIFVFLSIFWLISCSLVPSNANIKRKQSMQTALESPELRLVSQSHPLPDGWTPDEIVEFEGNEINNAILTPLEDFVNAARKKGHTKIKVFSAYRSYERQVRVFNNRLESFVASGMTEEEARNKTSTMIAVPGTSEHQYGYAVDICISDIVDFYGELHEAFAATKEFNWLNKHAHKYGFVLRYGKDKTEITKIIYEPWHYRYVGKEHAKRMRKLNLCLEEYVEKLQSDLKTINAK